MKFILKRLSLGSIILFLFFQSYLYSQHLHRSDGSRYPLQVSPHHVNVRFRPDISNEQKKAYLSALSEIDGAKSKRGLPNGFITLPAKAGTNINKLIQTLRRSGNFINIDPVYMSIYGTERFMFDEFMVRFKSHVSNSDIEIFSARHNIEIVKILDVEPTQYTFRVTSQSAGDALIMANM